MNPYHDKKNGEFTSGPGGEKMAGNEHASDSKTHRAVAAVVTNRYIGMIGDGDWLGSDMYGPRDAHPLPNDPPPVTRSALVAKPSPNRSTVGSGQKNQDRVNRELMAQDRANAHSKQFEAMEQRRLDRTYGGTRSERGMARARKRR